MNTKSFIVILVVLLSAACKQNLKNEFNITKLKCELQENPLGVDTPQPGFSWVIESTLRGQRQTAYEVLVASSQEKLKKDEADYWNSGKVNSSQSANVCWEGKILEPSSHYFWKVRVWDSEGQVSKWSPVATFSTGLLSSGWGESQWIRVPENIKTDSSVVIPWFRKTFDFEGKAKSALIHIASRGYHELWVNGAKVGNGVLTPAVSVLSKRSLYVSYDIDSLLKEGSNCIGVWLGGGWHASTTPGIIDDRPMMRIKGKITSENGLFQIISDENWKCTASSYSVLGSWKWGNFGGERYDARLENPDWSGPDLDDSSWIHAEMVQNQPESIDAQIAPLNRIGKRIQAVTCSEKTEEGTYELDFGTDLTGWVQLRMPLLDAGQKIVLRYYDSGGNYFNQRDEFISSGKAGEFFISKFNYRGFRTVIVEGLPAQPALNDAEALLIESDLETVGSFESSNELFNQIQQFNMWTIRCLNLGGYMVDCPHRERLGYGDGQVSLEGVMMNMWAPKFYEKWAQDWVDTQHPKTGALPFCTPYHPFGKGVEIDGTEFGREGPPGWGGALPSIVWRTYLYYGDTTMLERFYEPMLHFVEGLESHTQEGLLRGYGDIWQRLGDWLPPRRGMDTNNWPGERSNELFNNCYYIYLWDLVIKSANVLGRESDVQRATALIKKIRPLIHEEYYNEEKGIYVVEEQAYQLMPLMTGVVPEELRAAVMKKLEKMIMVNRDGHLDTGMLGTYFLFSYLSKIGRDDLLYTIVNQTTYPGWGYMLEQGATTMWEQWNGAASRIHSCFTSPAGWLHNGLAGIQPDESAPGFKKIIIRPAQVGSLEWVKAEYESVHGRILSHWQKHGDTFMLEVTIPANTSATIYLPALNAGTVTEGGKSVKEVPMVSFLRMEMGYAIYSVGSGQYQFQSHL